MNKQNRSIEDIREDLIFITSNKLSLMQSKLLFMGITYEIILRTDLFPKNESLKPFIEKIYIKRFKKKKLFKSYVYFSRTLLASRVQRKISSDLNYTDIIEIINDINKIFNNIIKNNKSKNNKSKNNKSKNNNDYITEWMKYIGSKK